MNLRRIPIIPTLIVLAAVAVMLRLGFWQLERMHQKEAMIARYAASVENPRVEVLTSVPAGEEFHYRHASVFCRRVSGIMVTAGHNARGETGWAHVARCLTGAEQPIPGIDDQVTSADVVLGWSDNPAEVAWTGGRVNGVIAPGGELKVRLIADPPLAGLAANARPDPNDIPNNHLSYAVQWFLFAATALVIYGLALRKRLAAKGEQG